MSNRKAAKFTAEMAEKALREEEEERPAVAVQTKVFTMEIVKMKRKEDFLLLKNLLLLRVDIALILVLPPRWDPALDAFQIAEATGQLLHLAVGLRLRDHWYLSTSLKEDIKALPR